MSAARLHGMAHRRHAVRPRGSPREFLAGTVQPAAPLTGIDSGLLGNVIVTATLNVYDTVSRPILLHPLCGGSRLLGVDDRKIAHRECWVSGAACERVRVRRREEDYSFGARIELRMLSRVQRQLSDKGIVPPLSGWLIGCRMRPDPRWLSEPMAVRS